MVEHSRLAPDECRTHLKPFLKNRKIVVQHKHAHCFVICTYLVKTVWFPVKLPELLHCVRLYLKYVSVKTECCIHSVVKYVDVDGCVLRGTNVVPRSFIVAIANMAE